MTVFYPSARNRKYTVQLIARAAKSQYDLGGTINDHIGASVEEWSREMRKPCARPDVAELIIHQITRNLHDLGYRW